MLDKFLNNLTIGKLLTFIILIVLIVSGTTFAAWTWIGDPLTNISFIIEKNEYTCYADGGKSITSDETIIMPAKCNSNNAIMREITTKAEFETIGIGVNYNLWLNINELGEGLSNSDNFRYVVTTSETSCTSDIVSEGNFKNKVSGDKVNILNTEYTENIQEKYYLYIWLDEAETNPATANQTFNFSLGGDCPEMNYSKVNFDAMGGTIGTNTYTEPKEHIFTAPYDATYQLEVWGAQGANASNYIGGYGGYGTGQVNLKQGEKLYVNIGGVGENYNYSTNTASTAKGGYNGGGYGHTNSTTWKYRYLYAGGGATHISKTPGLLSTLEDKQEEILIVAGGGGSASSQDSGGSLYSHTIGGSGGGYIGNSVTMISRNWTCNEETTSTFSSTGGTQDSPGEHKSCNNVYSSIFNGFGQGAKNGENITENDAVWGGGGGYYGGAYGAGGSGYIGNSLLINKYMYCYNCNTSSEKNTLTYTTTQVTSDLKSNNAKIGNGGAKIYLIDYTKNIELEETYGELPTPTKEGYTFVEWNTQADGNGTTITEETVAQTKGIQTIYAIWQPNTYTVTYEGNKFNTDISKTINGVTYSYNPNTSYLTLNGTQTATIDLMDLTNQTFKQNEEYKITLTYISGTLTKNGSGCFATELKKSDDSSLTTRNYSDTQIPTSGSNTSTLTISETGANEGGLLQVRIWSGASGNLVYDNYVIKVVITKVETNNVIYGENYILPENPTRLGYTFNGWYTSETGGTKVTTATQVTMGQNHTLYARWRINNVIIRYHVNGGTVTASTTSSGGTTYKWTTTNSLIYLNGNIHQNKINYGATQSSDGLPNYNNSTYLNITRTNYKAVSGAEWKCLSGCTTSGKTYSQTTAYNASDFCNASNGDCTVVLGVNWTQARSIPQFTYTGSYQIVNDSDTVISNVDTYTGNWKIRFLTSGTLTFTSLNGATNGIDVFLVGGGGNGGTPDSSNSASSGGGGGYTRNEKNVNIQTGIPYKIYIGQATETTTAFDLKAAGGKNGNPLGGGGGGNGGSGGGTYGDIPGRNAASYGNDAGSSKGQISTPGPNGEYGNTREFGEANAKGYGDGGTGGSWHSNYTSPPNGGGLPGGDGTPNTGGGGGGSNLQTGKTGKGGSGIVIIRNARMSPEKNKIPKFTYTGRYQIVDDQDNYIYSSTGNWKIKFLSSGTLTFKDLKNNSNKIDAFLVGGGGNGGTPDSSYGASAGGGGGYTKTQKNISIQTGLSYTINVGLATETTTAFNVKAVGGKNGGSGPSGKGGNGGSGGGDYGDIPGRNAASYGNDAKTGKGQISTPGSNGETGNTREFGEANAKGYGDGGTGGSWHSNYTSPPNGGGLPSADGAPNTGGGGGGANLNTYKTGTGGSGIVIIRNAR